MEVEVIDEADRHISFSKRNRATGSQSGAGKGHRVTLIAPSLVMASAAALQLHFIAVSSRSSAGLGRQDRPSGGRQAARPRLDGRPAIPGAGHPVQHAPALRSTAAGPIMEFPKILSH